MSKTKRAKITKSCGASCAYCRSNRTIKNQKLELKAKVEDPRPKFWCDDCGATSKDLCIC